MKITVNVTNGARSAINAVFLEVYTSGTPQNATVSVKPNVSF